jgi:hypothetical protein
VTLESMVAELVRCGAVGRDGRRDMELGQVGIYVVQQRLGALSRTLESWFKNGVIAGGRPEREAAELVVAALVVAVNFAGVDRIEGLLAAALRGKGE